jgi:ABC-2 type transport system ATP-binding protein
VLFSSHQLDLVERLCDDVVLIHRGRVVAAGPVADLRDAEAPRLVRVEVDGADGWWSRLPGVRVAEAIPGGAVLELTDGVGEGQVLDAARAVGDVRHFSVVRPSLTDVFRRAVAG